MMRFTDGFVNPKTSKKRYRVLLVDEHLSVIHLATQI
jgi:hypothetical protein